MKTRYCTVNTIFRYTVLFFLWLIQWRKWRLERSTKDVRVSLIIAYLSSVVHMLIRINQMYVKCVNNLPNVSKISIYAKIAQEAWKYEVVMSFFAFHRLFPFMDIEIFIAKYRQMTRCSTRNHMQIIFIILSINFNELNI